MIRPTRSAIVIYACSVLAALIAIALDRSLWPLAVYSSILIILAVLADAVLALHAQTLKLSFTVPETLYIGEKGEINARIARLSYPRRIFIETLLELRGEAKAPPTKHISVAPEEDREFSIPIAPLRRGVIAIDRLWMRWHGPFNLAQIGKTAKIDRTIDVIPNIRGVQRSELRFFAQDAIIGEKIQQKGEGSEFEALREYRQGLDIRFIDWKHSARHRKLLCKEFRTERNHPIILAFDTGHLMIDPLGSIPRLIMRSMRPCALPGCHYEAATWSVFSASTSVSVTTRTP